MSYQPINWKDRVPERPLTYRLQNNADGSVTFIPAHGTILQEGTPANAANLNHMEQGLVSHMADSMPHKTADGDYRWGLRINPDLSATLIYEAVV